MTKEELERIEQAYKSGLKVQIWFNGHWENFDIRDYSMYSEPFSENRQYRIVGSDYADMAEKRIAELEKENAKLKSRIEELEKQNKEAPKPSRVEDIKTKGTVSLVLADTDEWRKLVDSRAVKKTLSIPSWLNSKAEKAGINFSQLLQEAICRKLKISML